MTKLAKKTISPSKAKPELSIGCIGGVEAVEIINGADHDIEVYADGQLDCIIEPGTIVHRTWPERVVMVSTKKRIKPVEVEL